MYIIETLTGERLGAGDTKHHVDEELHRLNLEPYGAKTRPLPRHGRAHYVIQPHRARRDSYVIKAI